MCVMLCVCTAAELSFLETSALTGENVEEVFLKCTRSILAKIDAGQRQSSIILTEMIISMGALWYRAKLEFSCKHCSILIPYVLLQSKTTRFPIFIYLCPGLILLHTRVNLCVCVCTGELDPDRVGSGIQYGNAQLRRVTPQQQSGTSEKKKCC